jgi:hypothetical protein
MIKKYNQFIKRINEAGEEQAPVITPTPTTTPAPTETPSTTPDKRRERYTIQKPSVDPDPLASAGEGVEDSLEYLHDTLEGSELMNNILKYKGHEITLPSETEQFEVDGVRRIKREGGKLVPTSSSEDVIEYLNNPETQAEAQGAQSRRSQAQAQRGAQAQYENFETQDSEEYEEYKNDDPSDEDNSDYISGYDDEFETQTGKDPESEALSGEKVDVEETGKKRQAQFESKSYKSRFRTKL